MAAQPPASPPVVAQRPAAAPRDALDLDTQIDLVEQRLMAREQRLLGQAQDLRQRASRLLPTRALLVKAGGVVLAGAGLAWRLRRGGRHSPGRSHPAAPLPAAGAAPWLLGLLPMAWPLLPVRWRGRISPATAATLLGVAAPLVERLLARRRTTSADQARAAGAAPPRRRSGWW